MPELTSPHPIGEHAPQQSDLPAPPRAHALTLENRARLTVTGVTRIVSCDELGATLQTPLGDLTIGGQGMQVSELSVRSFFPLFLHESCALCRRACRIFLIRASSRCLNGCTA